MQTSRGQQRPAGTCVFGHGSSVNVLHMLGQWCVVERDSQQNEEFQQLIFHVTQFWYRFCQQDLLGLQAAIYTSTQTRFSTKQSGTQVTDRCVSVPVSVCVLKGASTARPGEEFPSRSGREEETAGSDGFLLHFSTSGNSS